MWLILSVVIGAVSETLAYKILFSGTRYLHYCCQDINPHMFWDWTLTFCHRSHDHTIRCIQFPVGALLELTQL